MFKILRCAVKGWSPKSRHQLTHADGQLSLGTWTGAAPLLYVPRGAYERFAAYSKPLVQRKVPGELALPAILGLLGDVQSYDCGGDVSENFS